MNSSRCSRLAVAALLALTVLAGSAGAVSVSGQTSQTVKVGTQQTATYTIAEPYSQYNTWTLQGSTGLADVTWQVTYHEQGGSVAKKSYTGQQFSRKVTVDDHISKITVQVEGTVPQVSQYSYSPAQRLTVAKFTQTHQGGASNAIGQAMTTQPYTPQSRTARHAIDDAKTAVTKAQSSGADVANAKDLLQNAVSAFDAGNFDNAVSLAKQAKQKANSSASSARTTHWLLIGGVAVVVLVVVLGGVWWYLNSRQSYDRLG